MEHILIVEDDPALGRGLTLALGGAHACTLASGCADARRALAAVTGLTLGADDYITKPFSLAVLRARVEAALRRNAPAAAPAVFEQDRFRFDFDRLDFAVEGRPLQLSQTEQRLLRLLVENRGHTLPRDTLLDRIWTDGADYVDENALSVTVGRLRRKLGKNAPIKTVYGVGYSWAVET